MDRSMQGSGAASRGRAGLIRLNPPRQMQGRDAVAGGAFFGVSPDLPAIPCVFGGDIYFWGSGIHWNGWLFKLTK